MKPILPIFIMLDACGWEIIKDRRFLDTTASHRKKLTSVFGYSSACVPSIVSGHWPDEHRNWCYFIYDPANSPFHFLKPLSWLPKALTSRRFFRRWLSKAVRAKLGYKGYFDLYNIPFQHISLYDFSEKKSPLQPRGMNAGSNIFDFLEFRKINYFGSDPDKGELENRDALIRAIKSEKVDFTFSYWPGLDGLLHRVGNDSSEIKGQLDTYEQWIDQVLAAAHEHYEEVHLYVFSDHGQANCDELLDLKSKIEALGLKMEKDYAVVYDSTMARFWFFNDDARRKVTKVLQTVPQGRILPDEELKEMHTYFPDHRFGELIFLVKEGVLIVPSHMGERPLRAMHGYHPLDKHSYASLFTNQAVLPEEVSAIPDIYKLMTHEATLAKAENKAQQIYALAGK